MGARLMNGRFRALHRGWHQGGARHPDPQPTRRGQGSRVEKGGFTSHIRHEHDDEACSASIAQGRNVSGRTEGVYRMKPWMILAAVLGLLGLLTSETFAASVEGYYRRDGTYVQPHQRTNPDNNYGFPGNVNPNTGRTTPDNSGTYLDNYNNPPGRLGTPQNPYSR
jgi:hypothetical protein